MSNKTPLKLRVRLKLKYLQKEIDSMVEWNFGYSPTKEVVLSDEQVTELKNCISIKNEILGE